MERGRQPPTHPLRFISLLTMPPSRPPKPSLHPQHLPGGRRQQKCPQQTLQAAILFLFFPFFPFFFFYPLLAACQDNRTKPQRRAPMTPPGESRGMTDPPHPEATAEGFFWGKNEKDLRQGSPAAPSPSCCSQGWLASCKGCKGGAVTGSASTLKPGSAPGRVRLQRPAPPPPRLFLGGRRGRNNQD